MRYIDTYDPSDFAGNCVYDQDEEPETPFEKLEVGDEVECTENEKNGKTITGYIVEKTEYEIRIQCEHGKLWLHNGDYTFLVI